MKAVEVYLALGSNIEPEFHLREAVARIREIDTVTGISAVWETRPIGEGSGNEIFLNAVIRLRTMRSAAEIITEIIPSIEQSLGRVRDPNNVNAPRTIDIDLTLYGDLIGTVAGHTLPDPEITDVLHLAGPLSELAPTMVISGQLRTIAEIAAELERDAPPLIRSDLDLTTT
jgi:2-amino-4-hydroxy-6-hydroxymethyldihydropteridine diphosphokinase